MKKIINLWMAVITICILSCSKDEPKEKEKDPVKTPSATLENKTVYQGDIVVIKGKNLDTDLSLYTLTIGDETYPLLSVDESKITFKVPEILKKYEQKCSVFLRIQFVRGNTNQNLIYDPYFTIQFKEPKGRWFYLSRFTTDAPSTISFSLTSDSTLWFATTTTLKRSTDIGRTWEDLYERYFGLGRAAFLDKKTAWVYSTDYSIGYTKDGTNFAESELKLFMKVGEAGMTADMSGMWMDAYNSGLVLFNRGRLYGIDNLVDKSYIAYEKDNLYSGCLSVIEKYNFSFYGYQTVNNTVVRYLIYKAPNQTPIEYNITSYISDHIRNLQMLKDQTIYFSTISGNFYKVTWPFTIKLLSQKADRFWFIDNQLAYTIFEGSIYKTIDNGLSWEKEFTIEDNLRPISIQEIGGIVVVLLQNKVKDSEFILLKYISN